MHPYNACFQPGYRFPLAQSNRERNGTKSVRIVVFGIIDAVVVKLALGAVDVVFVQVPVDVIPHINRGHI